MSMRVAAQLALAVGLACCRHGENTVAQRDEVTALQEAAKGCGEDADCLDVGPVCPWYCHYAIADVREHSEVFAQVDAARVRQASGECRMGCPREFFGLECISGVCSERKQRPTGSICLHSPGGMVDCSYVLRRFLLQEKCQDFCDGKLGEPTRIQFRIEPALGTTEGERYSIDYLTCEDCARVAKKDTSE